VLLGSAPCSCMNAAMRHSRPPIARPSGRVRRLAAHQRLTLRMIAHV